MLRWTLGGGAISLQGQQAGPNIAKVHLQVEKCGKAVQAAILTQ